MAGASRKETAVLCCVVYIYLRMPRLNVAMETRDVIKLSGKVGVSHSKTEEEENCSSQLWLADLEDNM